MALKPKYPAFSNRLDSQFSEKESTNAKILRNSFRNVMRMTSLRMMFPPNFGGLGFWNPLAVSGKSRFHNCGSVNPRSSYQSFCWTQSSLLVWNSRRFLGYFLSSAIDVFCWISASHVLHQLLLRCALVVQDGWKSKNWMISSYSKRMIFSQLWLDKIFANQLGWWNKWSIHGIHSLYAYLCPSICWWRALQEVDAGRWVVWAGGGRRWCR